MGYYCNNDGTIVGSANNMTELLKSEKDSDMQMSLWICGIQFKLISANVSQVK